MASGQLTGKTALVTGASSGLGVDFARSLAARGADVILVARRADRLERVSQDIADRYGVQARVYTSDLSDEANRQKLCEDVKANDLDVDILINNAGFGVYGEFRNVPWERTNAMLQVDIVALTHMTRLFVNDMVARGDGYIMLIGSSGSYQPTPTYGAYSAAKAYVLSFGHALQFELRKTGVSCTVVCPGITATEFLEVSGQKMTWYQEATMMRSDKVAETGVKSMLARRTERVPGLVNALTAFQMRFLPRPVAAWIAWFVMRND